MTLLKSIKYQIRRFFWKTRYGFYDQVWPLHPCRSRDVGDPGECCINLSDCPLVSIIIVTWNQAAYTKSCIESIFEHSDYPNLEIIVVDNGSKDNTLDYLKQVQCQRGNFGIIANEQNLGFGRANNIGIRQAKGEYIILLNNDTVVTKGWITGMIRHLGQPEIGMVGPVTNNVGNEARIRVYYKDLNEMAFFAERYAARNKGRVFDISMLAMYCVAMRRETVDKVGFLDEQFEIGMFEDNDYCRRIREIGLNIICAADVFIHHFGSITLGTLPSLEYQRIFEQNRKRFEAKWKL
jgi:GT2 family glycosyltransferase